MCLLLKHRRQKRPAPHFASIPQGPSKGFVVGKKNASCSVNLFSRRLRVARHGDSVSTPLA